MFDGATFNQSLDGERLTKQFDRVKAYVMDGKFHTLREIAEATGQPEQSISARLRDLRKPKFGSFTVERKRVLDPKRGIFAYRVELKETQLTLQF